MALAVQTVQRTEAIGIFIRKAEVAMLGCVQRSGLGRCSVTSAAQRASDFARDHSGLSRLEAPVDDLHVVFLLVAVIEELSCHEHFGLGDKEHAETLDSAVRTGAVRDLVRAGPRPRLGTRDPPRTPVVLLLRTEVVGLGGNRLDERLAAHAGHGALKPLGHVLGDARDARRAPVHAIDEEGVVLHGQVKGGERLDDECVQPASGAPGSRVDARKHLGGCQVKVFEYL